VPLYWDRWPLVYFAEDILAWKPLRVDSPLAFCAYCTLFIFELKVFWLQYH
jgi:hypothetical protein